LGAGCEEEIMDDALRAAKLAKLIEIEGYDSLEELAEAVFSDAVSCNHSRGRDNATAQTASIRLMAISWIRKK
jgi:hypothetical protein